MAKKKEPTSSRPTLSGGCTIHFDRNILDQVRRATARFKNETIPPSVVVEGNRLSVLTFPASSTNTHAVRHDFKVAASEQGARFTGAALPLADLLAKATHARGIATSGKSLQLLDEAGGAIDTGSGTSHAVGENAPDYVDQWDKKLAGLPRAGSMPTSLLRGMMSTMQSFVSTDETRANLSWVKFRVFPGQAEAYATNGHMLLVCRIRSPLIQVVHRIEHGFPLGALRSVSQLEGLTTVLHDGKDEAEWAVSSGNTTIHLAHALDFPPYDQILPREGGRYSSFEVDATEFRSVVEQAVAGSKGTGTEGANAKLLILETTGDTLSVKVGDTALRWTLPVEWRDEEHDFVSNVDPSYFAHCVRAVTSGSVTVRIRRSYTSGQNGILEPLHLEVVPFGDVDPDTAAEKIATLMPMKA